MRVILTYFLFILMFFHFPGRAQDTNLLALNTEEGSSLFWIGKEYQKPYHKLDKAYYLEMAGAGLLWSINYERSYPLGESSLLAFYGRAGISAFPVPFYGSYSGVAALPVEIGLFNKKKVGFEAGFGNTIYYLGELHRLNYLKAGIRMNKRNGSIVKVTPMLFFGIRDALDDQQISEVPRRMNTLLWAGFSFGRYF